jgi:hypothetical protein
MFRIKFILSDGRKVYPRDGGQYQTVDAGALESRLVRDIIAHGAYTPNLMFVMGGAQPGYLRIVRAELEPVTSPVDTTAFISGGGHAS